MARISEGTRTAQLLLEEFPLPERPPFYIFPRTLEEAFGLGHRGELIAPSEPVHPAEKIVLGASAGGAAVLLMLASAGVLP